MQSTTSDADSPTLEQIRSLVGLDPTEKENGTTVVSANPSDGNADELIDSGDFEEEEGPTSKKLWQRPIPKLIAVALPLGIVSLVAGAILANVAGMRLADTEKPEEVVTEVASSEDLNAQRQDEEIARLKTSNALGNQATVLDSQEARRAEIRPTYAEKFTSTSGSNPKTSEAQVRPQQSRTTTVSPTAIRSRPTPTARPALAPRSQVNYSASLSRTPVPVSSSVPTPPRTPQPSAITKTPQASAITRNSQPISSTDSEIDPFEQWQRLASLGSYGEMEAQAEAESGDAFNETQQAVIDAPLPSQNIPVMVNSSAEIAEETKDGFAVLVSDQATPKNLEAGGTYEDGVNFIMGNYTESDDGRGLIEIAPGVRASGEVVMPVAVAGDIESTVGAIELSEDLVSNGAVIMPAGTQMTVSVRSMSESGMMDLEVTSIVLPWSGYEQMQIPPEAISVQGGDGQVLMAQDRAGREGELRRLDRNQAFLGALGQVGSILNRPNSSSTSVGAGGSYSTSDYGSPSILGAILEGGANTMISQQQARNQERADRLADLPSVWVLEDGTKVEIFINQPVAWEQ